MSQRHTTPSPLLTKLIARAAAEAAAAAAVALIAEDAGEWVEGDHPRDEALGPNAELNGGRRPSV